MRRHHDMTNFILSMGGVFVIIQLALLIAAAFGGFSG